MSTQPNSGRRNCGRPYVAGSLLMVCAAFLWGCVTIGNDAIDNPSKFLNIREGKSTKEDVYAVFGQPHDVEYSLDGTQSLWTYFKVETAPNGWSYVPYVGLLAGGVNKDTTTLYLFFDTQSRLLRMQDTKKSEYENDWAGMARMAAQGNRDDRAEHVSREMAKIGKPFDEKLAHRVKFVH